jgi:hypothetical protein
VKRNNECYERKLLLRKSECNLIRGNPLLDRLPEVIEHVVELIELSPDHNDRSGGVSEMRVLCRKIQTIPKMNMNKYQ